MADNTLKKVSDWLKFQEEVYGSFRLPQAADDTSALTAAEGLNEPLADEDTHSSAPLGPHAGLSAISDLAELKKYCLQADILKTDLEGTNLVFGVGNAGADLMLIGEAPGEQEDRQGEPFVGKAGQLLNKILKAINFERDQVYIANILKHRPPNNRDPQPEEREKSLPILEKQIDLINPKLILCL
ncbi:MAG: uracil-DNA glycosylase, partial [Rhodothermaceae bacterium]|nr:uracil-DNA glycosylase [Rhodothermaceae bacterium]